MELYTLINVAVIAVPFALSFDGRVAFYRRWPALVSAMLPVSAAYLIWDVLVTARGDWWFNKAYAGEPVLFGLPLGEILFFVTVPYACLFIYEVVGAYFRERRVCSLRLVRVAGPTVSVMLLVVAAALSSRAYTPLALGSVAVFLLLAVMLDPALLASSQTWLFFGLSYLPFLLVNGILTGLPIVGYNPEAILGIRILSIPLEDFFYNFGMLGLYLLAFRMAKAVISMRARVRVWAAIAGVDAGAPASGDDRTGTEAVKQ